MNQYVASVKVLELEPRQILQDDVRQFHEILLEPAADIQSDRVLLLLEVLVNVVHNALIR